MSLPEMIRMLPSPSVKERKRLRVKLDELDENDGLHERSWKRRI